MILRIVVFPALIALAVIATQFANDAARLNRLAAAELGLERSTELAWKSMLENFSFSFYSGASDARERIDGLFAAAARRERLAHTATFAFFAAGASLLAWRSLHARRSVVAGNGLAADLAGVSLVALAAGIVAPILVFKAFANVPVLGTVILKFESKSVLTTVSTLFAGGNAGIGVLVAGFSIIIPAVKLLTVFAILQHRLPHLHARAYAFVKAIGKWSMADVFVVAILVAYFAAGKDEFSDARIGVGFYFFATYCVLSQLATSCLVRAHGTVNGERA